MENQPKFVDGLFVSRRENAPEFVKSNLSFLASKFKAFLDENVNDKGFVNIDLLLSKEGKLYAKLNDWKPSETFVKKESGSIGTEQVMETFDGKVVEDDINVDNIPF